MGINVIHVAVRGSGGRACAGQATAYASRHDCRGDREDRRADAGPHWEIYGDPDPSGGHFDVQVFWSLVAP